MKRVISRLPRHFIGAVLATGLSLSAQAQVKTDTGVYPLPSLPAMGATAGSKVTDPTFGVPILRLTDGSFGNPQCTVSYSNLAIFNADSTRVYVRCAPGSNAVFYKLNAATFTASDRTTVQSDPGTFQYWSIWSGVSPDVIFIPSSNAIYAYNVATQMFSVSTPGASVLGAGETFDAQMSRSEDDKVWTNKFYKNGNPGGFVVWRIESNGTQTVLLKVASTGVNELQVDKTGRYVSVVMDTNGPDNSIWDFSTMPGTERKTTAEFWHYDSGRGTLFTSFEPRTLGFRSLLTPSTVVKMLPDNSWSYLNQQDHFSTQADNELWAVGSRYRIANNTATYPFCTNNICAFDDEITQVSTDGSNRVRRLAHHRSLMPSGGYPEAPMANISRDGQYVAFTSNWGNVSGRLDVYLAQIPPAPLPVMPDAGMPDAGIPDAGMPDTTAPSFPENLMVQ